MPPNIALVIFLLFIAWLFYTECALRGRISATLCIPVIWIFLLGSRPVSYWLSGGSAVEADDYLEGSPTDRLVFLALIALAVIALLRRHVPWAVIIRNNQWLVIFFVYLGLSTLWSDYPFVSFKRWIKDLGNVVMVLLVLSERYPIDAVKAVFLRAIYLLIPLSAYLIKYQPEIGRYYDRWSGQAFYGGLTSNKNSFGMGLFVSGMFLSWHFLTRRTGGEKRPLQRLDTLGLLVLAVMTFWLFGKANSATAMACTLVGICILVATQIPALRLRFRRAEIYGLVFFVLLATLEATVGIAHVGTDALGRDSTLTGRTDIWESVLKEDINPVIGVGYYSFWLGDRVERLSRQYMYLLNEAHNGYIETYLNTGLIGVSLLLMLLLSAWSRIKQQVIEGSDWGGMRLALLITIAFYNLTEATFNRLSLVWLVLLFAVVEFPSHAAYRSAFPTADADGSAVPSTPFAQESQS